MFAVCPTMLLSSHQRPLALTKIESVPAPDRVKVLLLAVQWSAEGEKLKTANQAS